HRESFLSVKLSLRKLKSAFEFHWRVDPPKKFKRLPGVEPDSPRFPRRITLMLDTLEVFPSCQAFPENLLKSAPLSKFSSIAG
ncbi:MAG TPA: hypothetical protein PLV82_04320, partial [bacterium]|nr:hypothetical protein [bacterium]